MAKGKKRKMAGWEGFVKGLLRGAAPLWSIGIGIGNGVESGREFRIIFTGRMAV
jgi:hypothetical protein